MVQNNSIGSVFGFGFVVVVVVQVFFFLNKFFVLFVQ